MRTDNLQCEPEVKLLQVINKVPLGSSSTSQEYEATGSGCVTLGIWYEILVASPWISLPALLVSFHERSKYKSAVPLCLMLLFADGFHTKLQITGQAVDVYLTITSHLCAFAYFLYIYVERPVTCTSLGIKLFVFVTLALAIYFTLGITSYFSFSLISLLTTAVYSDRLNVKYCFCCLVLVPAIIFMVYIEAVHCNDFRLLLGFDAHLLTDMFAQLIVLLGVSVVWNTAQPIVPEDTEPKREEVSRKEVKSEHAQMDTSEKCADNLEPNKMTG